MEDPLNVSLVRTQSAKSDVSTKIGGSIDLGENPHLWYSRDTAAEGQFREAFPWFDRVRHLFTTIPDGATILDVGSNTGGMGERLLRERIGITVDGIDLAAHLLLLAKAKGYRTVWHGKGEALPCLDGAYDVVVMSEFLEHCEDPLACIREAYRVLRPGGMLLGDVPTWYGKWGYRSIRGHKWHRRVLTRRCLWALLYFRFSVDYIRPEPRWPTRHLWVPQWYTFRGQRR